MTDGTVYDMSAAVEAGAALLDTYEPGWFNRVNLTTLDVQSTCLCVLGQIFDEGDDYWTSGWGLGMRYLFGSTSGVEGMPYGFEINTTALMADRDAVYAALTEEWRTLIETRQSA